MGNSEIQVQNKERFECFCGAKFTDRSDLDGHLQSEHPENMFSCSCCHRLLPKSGDWTVENGIFKLTLRNEERQSMPVVQQVPNARKGN
jgi:hypothetical protein